MSSSAQSRIKAINVWVRARWPAVIAIGLASIALLVLCQHWFGVVKARGEIITSEINYRAGFAYVTPLWGGRARIAKRITADSDRSLPGSRLELFEDGKPLGPRNVHHTRIEQVGGGRYSHWSNSMLVFSASDSTDPRANGRRYTYRAPYAVSARAVAIAWLMIALASCFALYAHRKRLAAAWARAAPDLLPRYGQALLVPAIVSAAVLVSSPLIWGASDSEYLLRDDIGVVPHYPPLYPEWIALVKRLFGLSPAALWSLIAFQHLATVLSVAYFAAAFSTWRGRIGAGLLASIGLCMFLYVHGVFTEAPAQVFLLISIGATIRLTNPASPKWQNVLVFLGAIALATASRHPMIVAGVMLPAALLARAMVSGKFCARTWRDCLLACFGIVVAYVITGAIQSSYCRAGEHWCGSLIGRVGVYRIQNTMSELPGNMQQAWLDQLVSTTPDPLMKKALRIMAQDREPWFGTRKALERTPELAGIDPDDLLNRGFSLFLRNSGWPELRDFMVNFEGYFFPEYTSTPWRAGLHISDWALSRYWQTPEARMTLARVGFTPPSPESYGVLSMLVMLGDIQVIFVIAVAVVVALARRRKHVIYVVLTIAAGLLVFVVGCSIVTVYIPRYGLTSSLFAWVALACALLPMEYCKPAGAARASFQSGQPNIRSTTC